MSVIHRVRRERIKQKRMYDLKHDISHTRDDWIDFIRDYATRAKRNEEKDNDLFADSMVKIAALAIAAIEAEDEKKRQK